MKLTNCLKNILIKNWVTTDNNSFCVPTDKQILPKRLTPKPWWRRRECWKICCCSALSWRWSSCCRSSIASCSSTPKPRTTPRWWAGSGACAVPRGGAAPPPLWRHSPWRASWAGRCTSAFGTRTAFWSKSITSVREAVF